MGIWLDKRLGGMVVESADRLDIEHFRLWCARAGIKQNFTDEEAQTGYRWLEMEGDDYSDDGLPRGLIWKLCLYDRYLTEVWRETDRT